MVNQVTGSYDAVSSAMGMWDAASGSAQYFTGGRDYRILIENIEVRSGPFGGGGGAAGIQVAGAQWWLMFFRPEPRTAQIGPFVLEKNQGLAFSFSGDASLNVQFNMTWRRI